MQYTEPCTRVKEEEWRVQEERDADGVERGAKRAATGQCRRRACIRTRARSEEAHMAVSTCSSSSVLSQSCLRERLSAFAITIGVELADSLARTKTAQGMKAQEQELPYEEWDENEKDRD